MKNRIIYLLIIISTICVCIFFDTGAVRFLLAFEIGLIPVLILISFILSRYIKVQIEVPYYHVRKNNIFKINVHLSNSGILPVSLINVRLVCINEFTGKELKFSEQGMIDGKGNTTIEFMLESGYLGRFTIKGDSIYVSDYLGVFSWKIKLKNISDEFMVLPQFKRIYIGGDGVTKNKHEWEQYSHTISGEDTSEVFDVHEYRPGDTLQKMHWKLSAKVDEYMVKEYSMPIENMVLVFLDLYYEDTGAFTQDEQDRFLEELAALSWSMMELKLSHAVIWYSENDNTVSVSVVEYENDVYKMIESVCNDKIYEEYKDIRSLYMTKHEKIKTENSLLLDLKGNVYRDLNIIRKFSIENLEEELAEWKLEI